MTSGEIDRRILIVEDEPNVLTTIRHRLEAEGYTVDAVLDGETALKRLQNERYDLMLLDVALPGMSGLELCCQLRERGERMPILMLTALGQVVDRVVGLKLGADDYLTKPFEMIELIARVDALLRRSQNRETRRPDEIQVGELRIDLRHSQVFRGDDEVSLSALEFKLLKYFVEHRGALISREELLDRVWAYDSAMQTRTVDVHIASLRQKIEATPSKPQCIVTVHRYGYRFVG